MLLSQERWQKMALDPNFYAEDVVDELFTRLSNPSKRFFCNK